MPHAMTLAQYVSWFRSKHGAYILEAATQEIGPILGPTSPPGLIPWQLKWAVLFKDDHYVFVRENFVYTKAPGIGQRRDFSFHYGRAPLARDGNGFPIFRTGLDQAILRIDRHEPIGPHLHYSGENHIPQSQVQGLEIEKMDLFDFMAAVNMHRQTGAAFDQILNFKVVS